MKTLLVILNSEIQPFGKVLNAIGHMMVGIAPRIPMGKFPDIKIYSASTPLVRHFRQSASHLHSKLDLQDNAFSDFAHTTTDGSAQDHESQTKAISEADIHYYAACFCAESDNLLPLYLLLSKGEYQKLKLSTFSTELKQSEFKFEAPIEYPEHPTFTEQRKKFSIVLSPTLKTPDTIHELIRSCLTLGNTVNREELRLHQYPDANGIIHPGMSEYGLVALKAKTAKRLEELKQASEAIKIDSRSECKNALTTQTTAVALFGEIDVLNSATQKNISLWNGNLQPEDFDLTPEELTLPFKQADTTLSTEPSSGIYAQYGMDRTSEKPTSEPDATALNTSLKTLSLSM